MTIAKNTNRAKQAIANAKDIRCFSLSNGFSGAPLADNPVVLADYDLDGLNAISMRKLETVSQSDFLSIELRGRNSKLSAYDSKYILHVHSNLWYEFKA